MKIHIRKLLTLSLPPLQSTTTISPPPAEQPLTSPPSQQSQTTVLTLLFAVFVVLFMCFISSTLHWFCKEHTIDSPRRRQLSSLRRTMSYPPLGLPPGSNQRKGVDPMTIRALPVYSYSLDSKYQVDCAICLSEFEEKEAVKEIPFCKHVFHPICIDTWLSSNVTCPVCRSAQLSEVTEEGSRRSTIGNQDTNIAVTVVGGSFSFGMRGNTSCPRIRDPTVLQRMSSF